MSLTIKEIFTDKEKKKFIDFPHDLYASDPNYVPELHIGQAELMSPKKNPFFENAKVSLFLALRNEKIVGRISAIKNNNYNDYHNCNVGFFGFFDCIDDDEVGALLFKTVKEWHIAEEHDAILGPTNFSTNDTAGLLIEGFDLPPVVMMTYNQPYYIRLVENAGYKKEMDLFAYRINTNSVSEKSLRISGMLEERLKKKNITLRSLNLKNFDSEVEKLREIYNKAWAKNWGFVPFTPAEFDHLADGLKMIVDPKYAYIAEDGDKVAGFMIALPNINEIMIKNKRGRLFPFGIFRLLFGKSKTKILRIITLGVVDEYRKLGIEGLFYAKVIRAAKENNIEYGEASWILENNEMMVQGAKNLNGEKYKTYRIYSHSLK